VTTNDDALTDQVRQVMADEVAPLLGMDGGRVEIVGVEQGVVRVRFEGSCAGCPTTVHALIMALEEELRRRVPGVEYLEAVP
jgi:Fe-S cluster biogenesis protein NfuA